MGFDSAMLGRPQVRQHGMACFSGIGPAFRRGASLALVHRNSALGDAPMGKPCLGQRHMSHQPRPQPRRGGEGALVRLVSKDSSQVSRGHTKGSREGPAGQGQDLSLFG